MGNYAVEEGAMSFAMTESQQMIAQMCRDFAEKEIRPNIMKWDESQEFPVCDRPYRDRQGMREHRPERGRS
jgi:hypothetical protein